jgi:hypothetical protein
VCRATSDDARGQGPAQRTVTLRQRQARASSDGAGSLPIGSSKRVAGQGPCTWEDQRRLLQGGAEQMQRTQRLTRGRSAGLLAARRLREQCAGERAGGRGSVSRGARSLSRRGSRLQGSSRRVQQGCTRAVGQGPGGSFGVLRAWSGASGSGGWMDATSSLRRVLSYSMTGSRGVPTAVDSAGATVRGVFPVYPICATVRDPKNIV